MGSPRALSEAVAAAGLDWIVPDWPAPANVHAVFATRDGDSRIDAFVPAPPVWLSQVHGTAVAALDRTVLDAARIAPPEADAAVTRERGVVCAVRSADCLPIFFADRAGTAVGVAHAGWRGLAAGVIGSTLAALLDAGTKPENIVAWLGPAIGPRAFEVGRDVREAFRATDGGAAACFVPLREDKWLADLYGLARRQLVAAGVGTVGGGGFCTYSDAARFHSHRRDHDGGRMAALIWLDDD